MELLAESMQWCSTQKSCQNRSFNVSNGDVFRWSEVRSHARLGLVPALLHGWVWPALLHGWLRPACAGRCANM